MIIKKEVKSFRINWISFVVAFLLGTVYIYISEPPVRTVIKYPTPYNVNKIVYKNENEQCYMYNAEEVKCTNNDFPQPLI
jgi:hypothetical protein